MDFRKSFLAISIISGITGVYSPVAIAAESNSGATDAQKKKNIEVVSVTGSYSSSLQEALAVKRNNSNVIDSINAEDVGKFPTENVAESLQLIPGVTISRSRGEGLHVSVRGLGPTFQATTLNGRAIAVNENVENSGQSGRQFRYDILPTEIVSSIEVYKSPSAEMDDGAIGGNINIETFKPIALGDVTFSGSAQLRYNDLSGKSDPRFSGLSSWVNDDENLGVLISGVYSKRQVQQERVNDINWSKFERSDYDLDGDGNNDTAGEFISSLSARPVIEYENRERFGVDMAVQWLPTADLDMNLDILYTELSVDYDEYSLGFFGNPGNVTPGTAVFRDNALVGASITNGKVQSTHETSSLIHDSLVVGYSVDWNLNDEWDVSFDSVYSKATSDTDTPIQRTRFRASGVSFDTQWPQAGQELPSYTNVSIDVDSPNGIPMRRLEWRDITSIDEVMSLQFDAQYYLENSAIESIKFGAKYTDRSREYNRRDIRDSSNAGQFFDGDNIESFPDSAAFSESSAIFPRTWLVPSQNLHDGFPNAQMLASPLTSGDRRNSYKVEEEITGVYAMADFSTELGDVPVSGNFGVRWVQTQQTPSGYVDTNGQLAPQSFPSKYSNVLPSMNVKFELNDDIQVRFTAAKVITRPSVADLAPRLTLDSSGEVFEAKGGNPLLEPFQAWQSDLVFEWYMDESSALILGAFYKDITTFIANADFNINVDGQDYHMVAKTNGGEAQIQGLEFGYQKQFDNGFGVQANYTYTDTDATYIDVDIVTKGPFINIPENSYNVVGYYETDNFGARIAYRWTDSLLLRAESDTRPPVFADDYATIDLNFSYQFSDNISTTFDITNVTDESYTQSTFGNELVQYGYYGRTAKLGINYKF